MRKIAVFLSVSFWPLSLFLANTKADFLTYLLPVFFILISFFIYKKRWKFYGLPILFISLIEPKLALFPIVFFLIDLVFGKMEKTKFVFLIVSIVILFVKWHSFWGQTIFVPDYEARQEVIRETQLYPSVLLARTFHNKARIVFDKFTYNFFALTDPNNYFFGFAPRQIVNNQNLIKFPFLAILFVLYGLFYINKNKYKNFIYSSFAGALISLSFLTVFDRNDFILWMPLTLLFTQGIFSLEKRFKFSVWIFILFIIFAIPDLLRILIIYG